MVHHINYHQFNNHCNHSTCGLPLRCVKKFAVMLPKKQSMIESSQQTVQLTSKTSMTTDAPLDKIHQFLTTDTDFRAYQKYITYKCNDTSFYSDY